jgi:hypothetical protein
MSDDFEKLIPDFLAVARRIFDAGKVAGVKEERERVLAAIQSAATVAPPHHQPAVPRTRPPGSTSRRQIGYSEIAKVVLHAMSELAGESPEGVGAQDILRYFETHQIDMTELQVRAGIKHLYVTGRASRPNRGRYLPSEAAEPFSQEEIPDAGASGPFSLAAE